MKNDNLITVEIEINYTNIPQLSTPSSCEKIELNKVKSSATVKLPKDKIKGTFIESVLQNSADDNSIKISLKSSKQSITINSLIDCLEYINDNNYEFNFSQDNLISYLFAFNICKIDNKKKEVYDKLLFKITEENFGSVIQSISTLKEESLYGYAFYLIRHIINIYYGLSPITFNDNVKYNFDEIVHFDLKNTKLTFNENKIIISNVARKINTTAFLSFLKNYYENLREKKKKFFKTNNCFNVGVVYQKKQGKYVFDYPHVYQMSLENDKEITLFAQRASENSSFIISSDLNDFTKHGPNYIGEIKVNFWGTSFTVCDYGYDSQINCPKLISSEKNTLGTITYETNIMGEEPRNFKIDILNDEGVNECLENVKPTWNFYMDCYTLNFYGRVKKASAKNFQIINPENPDEILLQHGKVNKGEYNIDYREPFCPIFAFAVSLASIEKKRAVS